MNAQTDPIDRVYNWLEDERYGFVYDPSLTEKDSLELREKEIRKRRKDQK